MKPQPPVTAMRMRAPPGPAGTSAATLATASSTWSTSSSRHIRVDRQADVTLADVLGHRQAPAGRVLGEHGLPVQRQVVDLAGQPDVVALGQPPLEPGTIDAGRQQRDVLVDVAPAAGRLGERAQEVRVPASPASYRAATARRRSMNWSIRRRCTSPAAACCSLIRQAYPCADMMIRAERSPCPDRGRSCASCRQIGPTRSGSCRPRRR